MVNAFDLKDLAERLKAKGLPMLENDIQMATREIFAWTTESCALKGGVMAVAVPLLPLVLEQIEKLEDKLDGVVDPIA